MKDGTVVPSVVISENAKALTCESFTRQDIRIMLLDLCRARCIVKPDGEYERTNEPCRRRRERLPPEQRGASASRREHEAPWPSTDRMDLKGEDGVGVGRDVRSLAPRICLGLASFLGRGSALRNGSSYTRKSNRGP